MTLTETRSESTILSFLRGKGIIRRCTGGFTRPASISGLLSDETNHFLVANDGKRDVGFVCLFRVGDLGYALHLCLRTVGDKTKMVIDKALEYASKILGADHIYAVYPKSARAVRELCAYFGFVPDAAIRGLFTAELPEPYAFERLDIT
jgi:hypothetical protein